MAFKKKIIAFINLAWLFVESMSSAVDIDNYTFLTGLKRNKKSKCQIHV